MELFKIAIFVVIVFICAFTIIDRICKCFEQCAIAKAYGKYIENASGKSLKTVVEEIKNGTTGELH